MAPLNKDLRAAARLLGPKEARYLVKSYYQRQHDRIEASGQVKSVGGMSPEHLKIFGYHVPKDCKYLGQKDACHVEGKEYSVTQEPSVFLVWEFEYQRTLERRLSAALDAYSGAQELGKWARSITGVGPVIAAGFLAHIDIDRAPTCGAIWRFAGLDPTSVWNKKEKRPWNTDLKVLCWKLGESFVKSSGNKRSFYGPLYKARKLLETERNDAGLNAATAKNILETKNIGKKTEAYKWLMQGVLPPAHIQARTTRYTVKLFLAHYHHVAWNLKHGRDPVKPYILTTENHGHEIVAPNWPMESGLSHKC